MTRTLLESRIKQQCAASAVVLFLIAIGSQQASAQNVFPSSGNVGIGTTMPSQPLEVVGNIFSTGTTMSVGRGQSTADVNLDVGTSRTGNGYTYLDLIGDTTYIDYGTRLIRFNSGPNTDSMLTHRGTGSLRINTNEPAPITFETSATERMRIDSNGNVGIGTTSFHNNVNVQTTKTIGAIATVGTYVMPNTGPNGSYRQGFGLNWYWDGAN